ncbi:hypothetical protein PMAYCL1PPCAC_15495, partial [Pristionchus mayeri]
WAWKFAGFENFCVNVILTSEHFITCHFRACSSFFKRAKTTGRQYPCRQGGRRCETLKDGKFTCKRCRFERCIALGMVYEGPMRMRRKPKEPSILQRMKMELRAFTERRREQEMKIITSHGGHKRLPHPTEELYDVHQDTCMEIYRIFIEESYAFFNNVFPAFAELGGREQELIFKDYIGKMSMVEAYHRTRQIWGDTNKYMMCSVMTCYDIDKPCLPEEQATAENADFLISYTKTYAEDQKGIFMPIFNKCLWTEREYYALMALVMSEIDMNSDISEEAQDILDRYRMDVFQDLQLHYRNELCLRDFATRLGNLMTLNHATQECKSLFKVFFRFYSTVFDVYMTDNLIRDFFL